MCILCNLLYFCDKLELYLQDYLIELHALQHKFISEYLMGFEAQREAKERQKEEGTEELKRFMMQEMARRFLYLKRNLVFEVQLNVEWYIKVTECNPML